MISNRSWREWARRWGVERLTGNFDLEDRVQPVVLVDDVRSLSLPPVVEIWNLRINQGAVAAQFGSLLVQPVTVPIVVIEVRVGVQPYYGVTDGDGAALYSSISPQKEQGAVGASCDAICRGGTGAGQLWSANGGTLSGTAVESAALGVIVLPGQYFWVQQNAVLTALEVNRVRWLEVPCQSDAQFTSLPRT